MNHDATHCADYKKSKCPKSCYRAQLTEELKHICYGLPTSWSHFEGTRECPKTKKGGTLPSRYCKKCYHDVGKTALYCPRCGKKLTKESEIAE